MFLHLSVSHSVHGAGGGEYLAGTPPQQIHSPGHSGCWDTVNKRAVRVTVPLECILVFIFINASIGSIVNSAI